MAEFRDLITLQQSNTLPDTKNVGGVLIQKSLERIEAIEGEVLPAIDDNSSKMLAELKKHTKLLESILNIIKSEAVETTREDRIEAQRVVADQAEVIKQIEENTKPEKSEAVQSTREDIVETQRVVEKQAELIAQIEENTRPRKAAEGKVDKKDQDFRLGGLGTAIAVALGGIVGAVQGYIKALKFFGNGLTKALKLFETGVSKVANWILDAFPSIRKAFTAVRETVVSGVQTIKNGFTNGVELLKGGFAKGLESIKTAFSNFASKAVKVFDSILDFFPRARTALNNGIKLFEDVFSKFVSKSASVFDSVVDFFKRITNIKGGLPSIGDMLTNAKSVVTNFFKPISDAFKTLQETSRPIAKAVDKFNDIFESIKGFFQLISGKLSSFAKAFGAVAKIVSKIAYPLTVIMTVWDTVKGAIQGFEKEGVIGAISGAIKGFVNSLIMAPLDMLKDAVSWIVGAFGFDKAEKFLDSFSFEDLFSKFTDALFHPVETLSKLMSGVGDAMDKNIVQPLQEAFKPVKDFFASIKDSVVGMLQSISIPEISFTIPVIDKKISIGPFFPFGKAQPAKPAAGGDTAAKPAAQPQVGSKQTAPGVTPATTGASSPVTAPQSKVSETNKNVTILQGQQASYYKPETSKTSAVATPEKPASKTKLMDAAKPVERVTETRESIKSSSERTEATVIKAMPNELKELSIKNPELFAKLVKTSDDIAEPEISKLKKDPSYIRLGTEQRENKIAEIRKKATAEAVTKLKPELEKAGILKAEKAVPEKAAVSQPTVAAATDRQPSEAVVATPAEADKPQSILEKGSISAERGDTGRDVVQLTQQVGTAPASTANNIYSRSAQNTVASQAPVAQPGGNVVVAPTTNVSNKTTNNIVRIPSRNADTTLNEYFRSRYAF